MKTILYGIFYFFLTLFFAYIFIKEKDLAKKFDAHREKFVNKITENTNIGKIITLSDNNKYYAEIFVYELLDNPLKKKQPTVYLKKIKKQDRFNPAFLILF